MPIVQDFDGVAAENGDDGAGEISRTSFEWRMKKEQS